MPMLTGQDECAKGFAELMARQSAWRHNSESEMIMLR